MFSTFVLDTSIPERFLWFSRKFFLTLQSDNGNGTKQLGWWLVDIYLFKFKRRNKFLPLDEVLKFLAKLHDWSKITQYTEY